MELKERISFRRLLSVVKTLSSSEKAKLRKELSKEDLMKIDKAHFAKILLQGPVYSQREVGVIEQNRKSIAKWRTRI